MVGFYVILTIAILYIAFMGGVIQNTMSIADIVATWKREVNN